MKYFLIAILLFITTGFAPEAGLKDGEYRKVSNSAFAEGERLKYKLHYGWINAGVAELRIKDNPVIVNGRECLHIVGIGQSINSFDMFYQVRDTYQTFIDKESIIPQRFIRDVDEDGYIIKRDIHFDHLDQTATCDFDKSDTVYNLPYAIQDMVSSFYYARCLIDYENISKGDYYSIPIFMDYEIYPLHIKFLGREQVKTKLGKFNCLVFKPAVQEGRIFNDDEDLTIYVSDDDNKIPIMVKADILIGSIKLSLLEYENLKNPLSSLVD
jgi:hypothetical protein